jgi:hypothetical protein
MTVDANRLLELLPTIYRIRDAEEGAGRGALRALLEVIADQVAVLEADVDQLYDDLFVETSADWVSPYIGDLVGHRTLYGVTGAVGSPRAEVANTIAYRRRKGTASMLEQIARDVTGWDARVTEFFNLLATTQYMNHVRRANVAWVDTGPTATLATIGGPFESATRTADVRSIVRRRGRHNIPNVGVSLWRIGDHELAASAAIKLVPTTASDRRYLFDPLGSNIALFSHAVAEETISQLAERANVPQPITRRELWDDLGSYYPQSIAVRFGEVTLPASSVAASDLSDTGGGGWAYSPSDRVLIDPELGRLSLPASLTVDGRSVAMTNPVVTYHYGAPGDLGGGQYDRETTFADDLVPVVPVTAPTGLAAAIAALGGSGVVEIRTNGPFTDTLAVALPAGARVEVRAANGFRPTIRLAAEWVVALGDDAELTLNGIVLSGAAVRVPASSGRGRLRLRHCTLVPGIASTLDGGPAQPGSPSLVVQSARVEVSIEHSIVGGLRVHGSAALDVTDTIVDATSQTGVAYAAIDGIGAGGRLTLHATTVIGKVHAEVVPVASDTIVAARLAPGDAWPHPLFVERRQQGCIRFSYVPPGSQTPRRFECQPAVLEDQLRVQPVFTSERFGDPGYGQLSDRCAKEILAGGDGECEMGAFNGLSAPQRETNLNVRLEEYLRFGLEAGVFFAS